MHRALMPLALLMLAAALTGCGMLAPTVAGSALAVTMAAEPATPVAGRDATLTFTVTQAGQPIGGARVLVVRRMIGVVHPGDDIVFESLEQGGGRYSALTSFASPGHWDVQVIVTPAAGEAQTASFALEVAEP